MKKLSLLLVLGAFVFTSCQKLDVDAENATAVKQNATEIFGNIDPNQDWSSVVSGTISVTADAPLKDIEKVQILTESPFINNDAKVLAEAKVSKGQTVQLSFDAPNSHQRLIAACVDSKGHYHAKGFDINQSTLNFRGTTTRAARRASDYPGSQVLKLTTANAELSYNALRTRFNNEADQTGNTYMKQIISQGNIGAWKNAGWESERLWKPTDNNNTGSSWKISSGTIMRNIDAMTEEEETSLKDLFGDFLTRKIGKERVDNREYIRNSDIVKLYNNHLTSDGTTPITVSPIFMASSEIGSCHLYYYYYNPSALNGMDEAEYIKTLPKFKAIQCWNTRKAANDAGKGEEDLFKIHEYLLPYYGDPETFMPQIISSATEGTFDQKIYRIRNVRQLDGKDYYMVNTGDDNKKLAVKYADNDEKINTQLWQVFTTTTGSKALFNLGTRKFLVWDGDWATTYSTDLNKMKSCLYRFEEIGDNKYRIFRYNDNSKGLGTDLTKKANNFRIATNKTANDGENFEWVFEEYTGSSNLSAVSNFEFEQFQQTTITSPALAIPKGYRIGFMLRKLKDVGKYVQGYRDITDCGHGCCFAYGNLNKEINTLTGHFATSTTKYTMEADDPRACYIAANGVTYIGFEDGADCQFNDMILEVSGYDQETYAEPPVATVENKSSGIQASIVYDLTEKEGYPYTLCFEDRPVTADYDMNDVVIRCKRKSGKYSDYVDLSLVACGGDDDLWIRGISSDLAEFYDGIDLQKREVHELFMVDADNGIHRFINTQKSSNGFEAPRIGVYKLKAGVTIPQFLSQIYIENHTTGQTVSVAKTGESPCGIIIPGNFDYPMEGQRITNVYELFEKWAGNSTDEEFKQWYNNEDEKKTIKMDDVLLGK